MNRVTCNGTASHPLTPVDRKWRKFFKDLEARVEEHGCKNNHAQTLAALEAIATPARQYDIKKTLELFEHCGGYCDCEVLFNVTDNYFDDLEEVAH